MTVKEIGEMLTTSRKEGIAEPGLRVTTVGELAKKLSQSSDVSEDKTPLLIPGTFFDTKRRKSVATSLMMED